MFEFVKILYDDIDIIPGIMEDNPCWYQDVNFLSTGAHHVEVCVTQWNENDFSLSDKTFSLCSGFSVCYIIFVFYNYGVNMFPLKLCFL